MAAGDRAYWSDLANTINPPLVRLVAQSVQSMTSGVAAAITYGSGSEDSDTHGFHDTSTNPTRITPTVSGWYQYIVTFSMSSAAITQMLTGIRKNGSNYGPLIALRPDAASSAASLVQATGHVSVNGSSDYLEQIGQYNSASTPLNTNVSSGVASTFELRFVRPL